MGIKQRIKYAIIGTLIAVDAILIGKITHDLATDETNARENLKNAVNGFYCNSPLAKSLEEEVTVNLGIIIESSLEKETSKINNAFLATKALYKKEFNINLTEEKAFLHLIPEYKSFKELPLPKQLEEKDAFIYLTKRSGSTIINHEVRAGVCYKSKVIIIQEIDLFSNEFLAALLAHEIAHLFYAKDLPPSYKDCLMSGPHEKVNNICKPEREMILFYRDRIW